jgi:hypothetical protein
MSTEDLMTQFVPLIPERRIVEIIRGYIADHATQTTRPDMNSEHHLLKLSEVIVDECTARITLWRLETAEVMVKERENNG